MKLTLIFLLSFVALLTFACKKNESATDTAASAGTATSTSATDASSTTSTTGTVSSLSDADKTFITKAAGGGMMEVNLGTLAAAKATSTAVKDFGKTLPMAKQIAGKLK